MIIVRSFYSVINENHCHVSITLAVNAIANHYHLHYDAGQLTRSRSISTRLQYSIIRKD